MIVVKNFPIIVLFILPLAALSQSSYIPMESKDLQLLDRLEIKSGDPNLNFSTIKPYNRRLITKEVQKIDSIDGSGKNTLYELSKIDKYNIQRFLMNNSEWFSTNGTFNSKKAFLNTFYKTPSNLLEVNTKNFFLVVNPVFQYQEMVEKGNRQNLFYGSYGVSLRGMISRKIGFDLYLTDNRERDPLYVQQWISAHSAVPGEGSWKALKSPGGIRYFDGRGSVSFNATKFIDVQIGYDRNFIGDGFRSLLMSDFSGNALFVKLNTHIWRFNFENLFMKLIPDYQNLTGSSLLPKKYFRMNYLSINATKWLNVGLFDAVMFARTDHYDFQYLIPVIFLRPSESDIGSKDNAMVGLNIKANIKKKVELYGQLMFDEFIFHELIRNKGFWANKFGYQVGLKYPDVLGAGNLDLQLESNRVRPFSYSHFDSLSDYTHHNEPFAHPLGANFQEYIAVLKYQPFHRLYMQAKTIYYYQGLDSAGINYGSNPLENYQTRTKDYGYKVGDGDKVKSFNLNLLTSYEIRENLFFDLNLQHRTYSIASGGNPKTTVVTVGVRWNMGRRDFDF